MKVILLKDIPKVGNRYDVKEFKEGYAQNVLLSKGLAELATPQALQALSARKAKMEKEKENESQAFADLVSSLNGATIEIALKANEKGNLFKAISAGDIAQSVQKQLGVSLDQSHIVVGHIKELGKHSVGIQKGSMKGIFHINIKAL